MQGGKIMQVTLKELVEKTSEGHRGLGVRVHHLISEQTWVGYLTSLKNSSSNLRAFVCSNGKYVKWNIAVVW